MMHSQMVRLTEFGGNLQALRDYLNASNGGNSERIARMQQALRHAVSDVLTHNQRQALIWYYFEHKTVSEIANALGVNKSSVSRRLRRAREKLKKTLYYGFFPEEEE